MIEENRIYRRKSDGKFCYVELSTGNSIHGYFTDHEGVFTGGFTATRENFDKSIYKTPVSIENYAIVDGEKVTEKESKVYYKNAVICTKGDESHISIRCIDENTAHTSMGRIVSETKSLKLKYKFEYSIVSLKHKIKH